MSKLPKFPFHSRMRGVRRATRYFTHNSFELRRRSQMVGLPRSLRASSPYGRKPSPGHRLAGAFFAPTLGSHAWLCRRHASHLSRQPFGQARRSDMVGEFKRWSRRPRCRCFNTSSMRWKRPIRNKALAKSAMISRSREELALRMKEPVTGILVKLLENAVASYCVNEHF